MKEASCNFMNISGNQAREQNQWSPILIAKKQIDQQIEALLEIARPENGRRAVKIAHPEATAPGWGLAPGTDVTINVLKPGESCLNIRKNSTMLEICIAGSGQVTVDGEVFQVNKNDVWNVPAMKVHNYLNTGNTPWVRLSYSNAPVLENLEIHYVEEFEGDIPPADAGKERIEPQLEKNKRARDMALREQITEKGAWLLGYEWLIDVDVIPSKSLLWPWEKVSSYFPTVEQLAKGYNGRRLFVLYNPATERRIGTTHNFFATISSSPPNNHHIPHRHSSSAINYYLRGSGYSKVNGQRIEWSEGDLLLSAPGWAMHSHHSGENGASALTVQDHPLQIAMESLIWQERIQEPIIALGSQPGFESNLSSI